MSLGLLSLTHSAGIQIVESTASCLMCCLRNSPLSYHVAGITGLPFISGILMECMAVPQLIVIYVKGTVLASD